MSFQSGMKILFCTALLKKYILYPFTKWFLKAGYIWRRTMEFSVDRIHNILWLGVGHKTTKNLIAIDIRFTTFQEALEVLIYKVDTRVFKAGYNSCTHKPVNLAKLRRWFFPIEISFCKWGLKVPFWSYDWL